MTKINQISGNVYMIGKFLPEVKLAINTFLVVDEKIAMIDAGSEATMDEMLEKISEVVDPRDIDYIFLTHEHPDHAGGLSKLVASAYNAKIVAHDHVHVYLAFMGIGGKNISVKGGEKFDLGNSTIEVIYTPIETHGCISFLLKPQNIFFSGDYFGQFMDEWTVYPRFNTEKVIENVQRFHAGLGHEPSKMREYLGSLVGASLSMIATAHGPVLNTDLDKIVESTFKSTKKPEEKGSFWSRIFRSKKPR